MSEELTPKEAEVRLEIIATINFANRILETDEWQYPSEESLDPNEVFSGPILDLNDESLTDREIAFVQNWITRQLGSDPDQAPIKAVYESPDGKTRVEVYDVPLGKGEEKWFISRWQNQGEKHSFVFWAEEVYQWQVEESGYTEV